MKLFAIYGNPVSHSKSPLLHNFVFKNLNFKNYCYTKILLLNGDDIIKNFRLLRLSGANVTVPFKENAFELCDEVVGVARDIKAVNTLIAKESRVIGFNTDAPGFMKAIEEFEGIKKVLIIGAGGTAKALAIALREASLDVTILNRSEARLSYFKVRHFKAFSWNDFYNKTPTHPPIHPYTHPPIHPFDLVINTTSAGLNDESLPLPKEMLEEILKNTKYAVDVIYGKKTPFLKLCNEFNIINKDGKDMLINQAVYANMLFSGNNDFEKVSKLMQEAILL